jgi:DNA-binding XRE family transcriptional regulator
MEDSQPMTGFELRLWRRGMNWTQERAAEELGVSLRTYKTYEKKAPPQLVILATQALEMRHENPAYRYTRSSMDN